MSRLRERAFTAAAKLVLPIVKYGYPVLRQKGAPEIRFASNYEPERVLELLG